VAALATTSLHITALGLPAYAMNEIIKYVAHIPRLAPWLRLSQHIPMFRRRYLVSQGNNAGSTPPASPLTHDHHRPAERADADTGARRSAQRSPQLYPRCVSPVLDPPAAQTPSPVHGPERLRLGFVGAPLSVAISYNFVTATTLVALVCWTKPSRIARGSDGAGFVLGLKTLLVGGCAGVGEECPLPWVYARESERKHPEKVVRRQRCGQGTSERVSFPMRALPSGANGRAATMQWQLACTFRSAPTPRVTTRSKS
jgi:hypothetical protein